MNIELTQELFARNSFSLSWGTERHKMHAFLSKLSELPRDFPSGYLFTLSCNLCFEYATLFRQRNNFSCCSTRVGLCVSVSSFRFFSSLMFYFALLLDLDAHVPFLSHYLMSLVCLFSCRDTLVCFHILLIFTQQFSRQRWLLVLTHSLSRYSHL